MQDLIVQPGAAPDSPFVIFIMGATATGKTDLALAIHDELNSAEQNSAMAGIDLISVDSALVYRGMDIGTAKPDAETLRRAPHQLIDIIDPAETYSAGQFREDALIMMQNSVAQKRTPLLVGGTMLYFNTLQKGMADMPTVADSVKLAIEEEARTHGITAMHERLKSVDPVSANRIHPNDPQRIKRALELFDYTGKTLTDFWQKQALSQSGFRFPYRRIKFALMPTDRAELRQRIEQRFDKMLQQGLIEEVEELFNRGDLNAGLPSIRAVGYRQVWAYLAGDYSFDEMREKAIIATAQLAKRQMTWLRKEQQCNFIDPNELKAQKVLKYLKHLLL
jgi:tRNA dimethylallyltransferase